MCGIAGISNASFKIESDYLNRISSMLTHRGPDGKGVFIEKHTALIHRRLSIIDITGGSQPMYNEDHSLVIVFNGEIYNYKSLKQDLEKKGHHFLTTSDTEVIIHAYEEWGSECLNKFAGMFAFAIFDRHVGKVFLARDRCGEKPLYYCIQNNTLFFASEIQPVLALAGHSTNIDWNSVYLYLRLGYIPSPGTFYQNIQKLPAGTMLHFKNGRIEVKSWYQPKITQTPIISKTENELCDELDLILNNAVKKMLVSEVPLGAFLSGGLDSSLIVAIMAKVGPTPKTFSIAFNHSSFDESKYALQVADFIGSDHKIHTVKFGDFEDSLSIMDCFGEPFADYSGIPSWYLSKKTRSMVTVALSGDGADELFGGYRRYISQQLAAYYKHIPFWIRSKIIAKSFSYLSDNDGYYADSLIKSARMFIQRFESVKGGLMLNTVFSDTEITSLFPAMKKCDEQFPSFSNKSSTEALMLSDRSNYLPDDIMVKVDRMSMQHSLETRAPFLDPDVLNFSEKIPLSMKIRGLTQKYLLKKVALRYLPKNIVFRKKHGFMVPMQKWLKKAGITDIRQRLPKIADSKAVNHILESHFNGGIDYSHKLFSLIILERYLKNGLTKQA